MKKQELIEVTSTIGNCTVLIIATAFLFLLSYRTARCLFFNIPFNYASLNIKSLLPVLAFILFWFSFDYLLIDSSVTYDNKLDKNSNPPNKKKATSHLYLRKVKPKLLRKLFYYQKARQIRNQFDKQNKKKQFKIHIQISNKTYNFLLALALLFNLYFSLEIQGDKTGTVFSDVLLLLFICVLPTSIFMIIYEDSILAVLYRLLKATDSRTSCTIENKEKRLKKPNHLGLFRLILNHALLLLFLLSFVFLSESCILYATHTYKTVEISHANYIVSLDDDDYYVLNPVTIINDQLEIDTNQYMYADKDNLLVKRVRYNSVCRK